MVLRHVWRYLSYLSLVMIAGLSIAGCVIQEPRAITEIGRARKALDDARRAGKADCAPGHLPSWKNAICRHGGCFMPVMMQRPYGKRRLWRQMLTRWAARKLLHPQRIGHQYAA